MRRALVLIVLAACATTPTPIERQAAVAETDESRGTVEQLRGAIAADPTNGPLIYTLAQYLDRSGDSGEALRWLGELERIGWNRGVNDHDFPHTLAAAAARYHPLARRMNERVPQIVRGTVAFIIPQPDLIPEGIAFDAATGDFYVSSIRLRKIVVVNRDGKYRDFVGEAQDGLFSTVGLRVDPAHRLLWVATAATPEMRGYTDAIAGQAGVFAYDLRDGHLVTKVLTGSAAEPSLLNDLALLEDGSAVVTDSARGSVVRVRLGSDSLDPWLPDDTFTFPNGIAAAGDEPFVYVADFHGVSRVDVRSRAVTPLHSPPGETIGGIDGLLHVRGALIGIQNSFGLPRVVRMTLGAKGPVVTGVETLESRNPLFDEPTTCAIGSDGLYYFANPQLRAFDEKHAIWPRERLTDVVVLKMAL